MVSESLSTTGKTLSTQIVWTRSRLSTTFTDGILERIKVLSFFSPFLPLAFSVNEKTVSKDGVIEC